MWYLCIDTYVLVFTFSFRSLMLSALLALKCFVTLSFGDLDQPPQSPLRREEGWGGGGRSSRKEDNSWILVIADETIEHISSHPPFTTVFAQSSTFAVESISLLREYTRNTSLPAPYSPRV